MLNKIESRWRELISGRIYYSVEEALISFKSPSSLARELNITLTLPQKSPKVFTYNQLNGLSSLSLVVTHLIDNCRVHAGRNTNVHITAHNDKSFQYVDVDDDGPGIKNIEEIKRDAVLFGRGNHHGSSLDLACFDSAAFGGIIIPSNIEDESGRAKGARLRIQIPLDKERMNRESAKELRLLTAKDLGLS